VVADSIQILCLDIDNHLVDLPSDIARVHDAFEEESNDQMDDVSGNISLMHHMPNAFKRDDYLANQLQLDVDISCTHRACACGRVMGFEVQVTFCP